MSMSRFPGPDVNKNYSVPQDMVSKITRVTKVVDKVVDAAHKFIDKVHSFKGFNW